MPSRVVTSVRSGEARLRMVQDMPFVDMRASDRRVRRGIFCAALAASFVLLLAPSPAPSLGAGAQVELSPVALGMVEQINLIRLAHGLVPLALATGLVRAAAAHCEQQVVDGYFGHRTARGAPFATRIAYYYPPDNAAFYGVGENLLWTSANLSAARAVSAWMQSAPHRANILKPAWRDIGVAALTVPSAQGVYGDQRVTVVAADFGVRAASAAGPIGQPLPAQWSDAGSRSPS